ncbi:unnamed protein product [Amoebophrya sp. A25]|nr:unnamed protein product [Amoebophrya sp. A25]|eukprot:GSA25T00003572001.1
MAPPRVLGTSLGGEGGSSTMHALRSEFEDVCEKSEELRAVTVALLREKEKTDLLLRLAGSGAGGAGSSTSGTSPSSSIGFPGGKDATRRNKDGASTSKVDQEDEDETSCSTANYDSVSWLEATSGESETDDREVLTHEILEALIELDWEELEERVELLDSATAAKKDKDKLLLGNGGSPTTFTSRSSYSATGSLMPRRPSVTSRYLKLEGNCPAILRDLLTLYNHIGHKRALRFQRELFPVLLPDAEQEDAMQFIADHVKSTASSSRGGRHSSAGVGPSGDDQKYPTSTLLARNMLQQEILKARAVADRYRVEAEAKEHREHWEQQLADKTADLERLEKEQMASEERFHEELVEVLGQIFNSQEDTERNMGKIMRVVQRTAGQVDRVHASTVVSNVMNQVVADRSGSWSGSGENDVVTGSGNTGNLPKTTLQPILKKPSVTTPTTSKNSIVQGQRLIGLPAEQQQQQNNINLHLEQRQQLQQTRQQLLQQSQQVQQLQTSSNLDVPRTPGASRTRKITPVLVNDAEVAPDQDLSDQEAAFALGRRRSKSKDRPPAPVEDEVFRNVDLNRAKGVMKNDVDHETSGEFSTPTTNHSNGFSDDMLDEVEELLERDIDITRSSSAIIGADGGRPKHDLDIFSDYPAFRRTSLRHSTMKAEGEVSMNMKGPGASRNAAASKNVAVLGKGPGGLDNGIGSAVVKGPGATSRATKGAAGSGKKGPPAGGKGGKGNNTTAVLKQGQNLRDQESTELLSDELEDEVDAEQVDEFQRQRTRSQSPPPPRSPSLSSPSASRKNFPSTRTPEPAKVRLMSGDPQTREKHEDDLHVVEVDFDDSTPLEAVFDRSRKDEQPAAASTKQSKQQTEQTDTSGEQTQNKTNKTGGAQMSKKNPQEQENTSYKSADNTTSPSRPSAKSVAAQQRAFDMPVSYEDHQEVDPELFEFQRSEEEDRDARLREVDAYSSGRTSLASSKAKADVLKSGGFASGSASATRSTSALAVQQEDVSNSTADDASTAQSGSAAKAKPSSPGRSVPSSRQSISLQPLSGQYHHSDPSRTSISRASTTSSSSNVTRSTSAAPSKSKSNAVVQGKKKPPSRVDHAGSIDISPSSPPPASGAKLTKSQSQTSVKMTSAFPPTSSSTAKAKQEQQGGSRQRQSQQQQQQQQLPRSQVPPQQHIQRQQASAQHEDDYDHEDHDELTNSTHEEMIVAENTRRNSQNRLASSVSSVPMPFSKQNSPDAVTFSPRAADVVARDVEIKMNDIRSNAGSWELLGNINLGHQGLMTGINLGQHQQQEEVSTTRASSSSSGADLSMLRTSQIARSSTGNHNGMRSSSPNIFMQQASQSQNTGSSLTNATNRGKGSITNSNNNGSTTSIMDSLYQHMVNRISSTGANGRGANGTAGGPQLSVNNFVAARSSRTSPSRGDNLNVMRASTSPPPPPVVVEPPHPPLRDRVSFGNAETLEIDVDAISKSTAAKRQKKSNRVLSQITQKKLKTFALAELEQVNTRPPPATSNFGGEGDDQQDMEEDDGDLWWTEDLDVGNNGSTSRSTPLSDDVVTGAEGHDFGSATLFSGERGGRVEQGTREQGERQLRTGQRQLQMSSGADGGLNISAAGGPQRALQMSSNSGAGTSTSGMINIAASTTVGHAPQGHQARSLQMSNSGAGGGVNIASTGRGSRGSSPGPSRALQKSNASSGGVDIAGTTFGGQQQQQRALQMSNAPSGGVDIFSSSAGSGTPGPGAPGDHDARDRDFEASSATSLVHPSSRSSRQQQNEIENRMDTTSTTSSSSNYTNNTGTTTGSNILPVATLRLNYSGNGGSSLGGNGNVGLPLGILKFGAGSPSSQQTRGSGKRVLQQHSSQQQVQQPASYSTTSSTRQSQGQQDTTRRQGSSSTSTFTPSASSLSPPSSSSPVAGVGAGVVAGVDHNNNKERGQQEVRAVLKPVARRASVGQTTDTLNFRARWSEMQSALMNQHRLHPTSI